MPVPTALFAAVGIIQAKSHRSVPNPPKPPGPFRSAFPGARIWWLEDDVALCQLMQPTLEACGWRLRSFHTPHELEQELEHGLPSLLLLDQMLPEKPGTQLLTNLRQGGHRFPVLMISALGAPSDRIVGLEVGANDYLSKPFVPLELELRIEALLRSNQLALPSTAAMGHLRLGNLDLQPHSNCLQATSGQQSRLSRGDTALLLCFAQNPNQVLSRERLARATGTLVDPSKSRSLDVRLSKLRRVLHELSQGEVSIEAVRGQGYWLSVRDPQQRCP